jgi:GTPase SAR1 family protein
LVLDFSIQSFQGGGGVGKTSLTVQLTENKFNEEYNPSKFKIS